MSSTVAEQPLSGAQAYAYIYKGAVARGLDPNAVLAVASKEGAGGGIGDGGHAFGPFQLNDAGGVITGKFPGKSPDQLNLWAWTTSGINYALDGIATVARGLTGAPAINAIVTGFERPANQPAEISGAVTNYGKVGPSWFGSPSGKSSGGGGSVGDVVAGGLVQGATGLPVPVIDAVGHAASHIPVIGGIIGGATSAIDSTGKLISKITDPGFWLRVLQILAGAGMAGIGLVLLVRQIGLADTSQSTIPVPIPVEV